MAERVLKDVGMLQREETRFFPDDPRDAEALRVALEAWVASFPEAEAGDWTGDARRRETANLFASLLASIGLEDQGTVALDTGRLRKKGLTEDTAYWIAAQWLAAHNGLMKARARFEQGDTSPSNMGTILHYAEQLGRLRERMFWRAGVDEATGARREALALERKKSRLALSDNPDRNHERQQRAAEWREVAQRLADECWQRRPQLSKAAVAREVLRNWPKGDDKPQSKPRLTSIRQNIARPEES
jgi:hypothetical protein